MLLDYEEWQELMAVRNRLDQQLLHLDEWVIRGCYDVMDKFALVRLQTVGGCHPKGSGGTNHLMTTKLAMTNKHKTVTQLCSAALAILGALGLNPLDIVICRRMQKWKTKPDILQMNVG